ncbi:DapH/DapD/GlmU-related protein [Variovorax sp. dw_308]|uniref:acyltransferase n=1 Tax=Variovorax sp. dw_308 TaxID=2721546 RepID=UPI001C49427E|nr:acyltransferase [Variovorax sp. dw_308]
MNYIHRTLRLLHRTSRAIGQRICRPSFARSGKNVVFDPLNSNFSYATIELGDNVFIGGRAWFSCAHGKIRIGSNVMFGPGVMILGGNHRIRNTGILMWQDNQKSGGDDKGVSIEDDVWIGANAVILEGVTIAQGSVVGAGAVVAKSTQAYSISAGVPAKKVGSRFDESELAEHLVRIRSART